MRQRRPREHDEKHLAFIRQLPCLICGDSTSTEAAHVSMADNRADKRYVGTSEKADDCWALPLCGAHHRDQHTVGEKRFWDFGVIDPIFVCLALWRVSGDCEAGERIIRAAQ